VADLASVFGLVLTATSLGLAVYTLWQARTVQEEAERLRSRFLLAQRAPGTVEELEEVARLINLQIKEAPLASHQLRAELERCRARLQNLEPKLRDERGALRRSKDLRSKIENALQGDTVEKEHLQEIYAGLQGLTTAAKQLLKDRAKEV
jgi:hypothetical protein